MISPDIKDRLASSVAERLAHHGLDLAAQPFVGEHMALSGGRIVRLDLTPGYWRDLDADDAAVLAAATELVDEFAARHGPGLAWALGPFVHFVEDDGKIVVGGRVRLRRFAAHEAQTRIRPIISLETTRDADRDGHRAVLAIRVGRETLHIAGFGRTEQLAEVEVERSLHEAIADLEQLNEIRRRKGKLDWGAL